MARQLTTSDAIADLRRRVDELGAEVARLKRVIRANGSTMAGQSRPWWEAMAGRFDGDLVFAEVVKQGRAWRAAQRPRAGVGRARS